MNINDAFPSNYIKASDLNGQEVPVTISNAAMEKLGDDTKPVIYFQGREKGMVLNKTNANTISDMYGDDTDGWLGKQITLYAAWVDYQGRQVQGIRVKPMQAQAPVAQPAPPPAGDDLNDEVPF